MLLHDYTLFIVQTKNSPDRVEDLVLKTFVKIFLNYEY